MKLNLLPDAKNCLCYVSPLSGFLYRRMHHEAVTGTSISPRSLLLSQSLFLKIVHSFLQWSFLGALAVIIQALTPC